MTFTELRTEIMDRLNLSSSDASTRVGRAINRKYRLVTSAIGLQLSRRATVQKAVTQGVSTVIFSNCEKIINVVNRNVSPYKVLAEVTLEELREVQPYASNDDPKKYAIAAVTADTVTIEIDRIPQTAFTLYADVMQSVTDLSGANEPAFPESFHDVIIEGVLADEYRKMENPAQAQIAQREYERILSDLRMWIAKSGYLDIYQGKTSSSVRTTGGGSGAGSGAVNGALSYTQTGQITFDRDPSPPFAVTASSAKVDNLDADKLDGYDESAFFKLADNETVTGNTTLSGTVALNGATTLGAGLNLNGQTVSGNATLSGTITHSGAVVVPTAAAPAQTAEGSVVWDSDDDKLTVGTGAGRKTMVDTDSTQTLTNKSIDAGQLTGTVVLARFPNSTFTVVTVTTTGTVNNWDPGISKNTLIYWNGASALTITGFAAGSDGQIIIIQNQNTPSISLKHNNAGSSAGNKLWNIVTSSDTPMAKGGYAVYMYDATNTVWRLLDHEQGSWITPSFAAGDWTATGGGSWGVDSGDVVTDAYYLSGRVLHFQIDVAATDVTGASNSSLNRSTYGFTVTKQANGFSINKNTGAAAWTVSWWGTTAGGTILQFTRDTALSNWTATSSDDCAVRAQGIVEVT